MKRGNAAVFFRGQEEKKCTKGNQKIKGENCHIMGCLYLTKYTIDGHTLQIKASHLMIVTFSHAVQTDVIRPAKKATNPDIG